ncbi:MAG: LD-carboxypeptidase [Muribaculum sp.]|nr:LD-carboxypeptidase [Muribaculum sp.]
MRYPKNLSPGGTIGFVAPSFGCRTEPYRSRFENAQKQFREQGYALDLGPNCYAGDGVGISSTPAKCAEELAAYYCSGENDCLISCGGGELMCEVLSQLDFARIKAAEPKWYMGYSDNTNFTYLLATLCDTASVYGPCAPAFGRVPWHDSLWDAMALLAGKQDAVAGYEKWERESEEGEDPLTPYHVTERRVLKTFVGREAAGAGSVRMSGRLLGGCMDCLVNLLGTRFDRTKAFVERYREDGIIWFLESCDLNVFGIRRAMWQMEEAGWFEHVNGFLIGRPLCIGQELMGLDAYDAVLEVAGKKQVPVVMDVDLGHLPPMMPLIVGSMGEVEAAGNDITVRMRRI